ncbi:hypothetical protein B0H14DRAFT_2868902, partial [Mycena olivaceomarginata]
MLLGRLICSTVTQLFQWHWSYTSAILDHLPLRPIWVKDHSTILAIASCHRTSTFHWANNGPLVLPPHETFGFVIDHYAVFDQVIVPMWMWLSICVQAVGIEEISHPVPSRDQTAILLGHVATSNTYNMLAERNKIKAWLDQHHISNDLRRAVDEKAGSPEWYSSRYAPVSLAMFLVVIREGKSLDNYDPWFVLESPSIRSPFATHHTVHSFQNSSTSSLPTEGPISHHPSSHSLRTIPEAVAHSSPHPSQLPASVQTTLQKGTSQMPLQAHLICY